MKNEISIVKFEDRIPLSFSVVEFDGLQRHMHSNAQLLINIGKEAFRIDIGGESFELHEDDVIMINPRTYHSIVGKGMAVSVLINPIGFGLSPEEAIGLSFRLNSTLAPENPRYNQIRYLVYSMIKYNTMENVNSIYTNQAIAYSFFAQLMNDFKATGEKKSASKGVDTITVLTSYIDSHFRENVSLSFLSEKFGYSVPYISRLFKTALNQNYLDYYDEVRVNYSLDDLLNGGKTVEEIALNNGFENARSYVRAFSKLYHCYPSEYRKKNKESSLSPSEEGELRKKAFHAILKRVDDYNQSEGKTESTRNTSVLLDLNLLGKGKECNNPLSTVLAIDSPSPLFYDSLVGEMRHLVSSIGFTTLEIKNAMVVSSPYFLLEKEGKKHINPAYFDQILKISSSLGLTPYLRFVFKEDELDLSSYSELLIDLLLYLSSKEEAKKTPHIKVGFAAENLTPAFLEAALKLTSFVKDHCPFRVVSPTFDLEGLGKNRLYESYRSSPIKPDYWSLSSSPKGESLEGDKDALAHLIEKAKEEKAYPSGRIFLEKVDYSPTPNELLKDTVYASSYLTRQGIAMFGEAYACANTGMFGFSLFEEDPLFHGSSSLLEKGLEKATCKASILFARLGKEVIEKGRDYILTKTEKGYALLFNNYCHYSDLYAKKQYYELSAEDRYRCFPKSTNIHYHLSLSNPFLKEVSVKITSVSKQSGSPFDTWVEMGAPNPLGEGELETIRGLSRMHFTRKKENVGKGVLNLEFSLEPLEIKLIEIEG